MSITDHTTADAFAREAERDVYDLTARSDVAEIARCVAFTVATRAPADPWETLMDEVSRIMGPLLP